VVSDPLVDLGSPISVAEPMEEGTEPRREWGGETGEAGLRNSETLVSSREEEGRSRRRSLGFLEFF